jgi:hypothetical protein
MNYKVYYGHNATVSLEIFCDSDYAGCLRNRRSTIGSLFYNEKHSCLMKVHTYKHEGPVEHELMAIAEATTEALWLRYFIKEMLSFRICILLYLNQTAIKICRISKNHKRSKHITIRYFCIREGMKSKILSLNYILLRTTRQTCSLCFYLLGNLDISRHIFIS